MKKWQRKPRLRYSMLIQWSDEDQGYVVSLPKWGNGVHAHGKTHTKAGREVLEMLLEDEKEGKPVPAPRTFDGEPDRSSAREQQSS